MNIPIMITKQNLAAILREFAAAIENDDVKIRKIDFQPMLEVQSANPFVFPVPNLENVDYEDSTTVFNLSVECKERKVAQKITEIIKES